jgi:hypothetical protein
MTPIAIVSHCTQYTLLGCSALEFPASIHWQVRVRISPTSGHPYLKCNLVATYQARIRLAPLAAETKSSMMRQARSDSKVVVTTRPRRPLQRQTPYRFAVELSIFSPVYFFSPSSPHRHRRTLVARPFFDKATVLPRLYPRCVYSVKEERQLFPKCRSFSSRLSLSLP